MPFEKGDKNINREGRPIGSKGLNLTSLLKDKLEEIPEGKTEAYKDLFIKTLLHKGLVEKDLQSIKLMMNYIDGLPKQTIDLNAKVDLSDEITKEASQAINTYLNEDTGDTKGE